VKLVMPESEGSIRSIFRHIWQRGPFFLRPVAAGYRRGLRERRKLFRGRPVHSSFLPGEVSANQAYERRIGDNLLFRLAPKGEHFGVGHSSRSERRGNTDQSEYVWVVTPPYRLGILVIGCLAWHEPK